MIFDTASSYEQLRRTFRWDLPDAFNIGLACADEPAAHHPDKPAIVDLTDSEPIVLTYAELARKSTQLASKLAQRGVARRDRIAIMLPQSAHAIIAHLAVYKLGAIAVPLAGQFGPDAIAHRLSTSGATAFLGSAEALARTPAKALQSLSPRAVNQGKAPGAEQIDALIEAGDAAFEPADTCPDDPAMMLFTSGTTGSAKGALHGHRVLLGHLPGIQMAQNLPPNGGDVFWTPSDWAWAGGLLNALLPALYYGLTVVAARTPRFDPQWAIDLLARGGVTNLVMPPTALRMLLAADIELPPQGLPLRVIGTAGEALGRETHAKARQAFGVPINEFYGQTECNLVLANSSALNINRAGAMGKPVPGHAVTILREDGSEAEIGETGEVAIHAPDPVMFLGYWNNEAATRAKFDGDWMRTGDSAYRDADGFFHFVGRMDDIIISSGYRIGPSEIEDCLTAHPDVAVAAVIGKPDPVRTEIVVAYTKLRHGVTANVAKKEAITDFVKTRLSAHQYPRQITFVDDIPLTETGKVIRRHFREG